MTANPVLDRKDPVFHERPQMLLVLHSLTKVTGQDYEDMNG
jgi:hypothetical protein